MFRRCQQWKKALGFVGDHKYANLIPEVAYTRIRVCRKHFDDESFTSSGKHLIITAVPSKFPTKLGSKKFSPLKAWNIFENELFAGNDQNDDNPGPTSVLAPSKLDACTQTDTCREFDQGKCQSSIMINIITYLH